MPDDQPLCDHCSAVIHNLSQKDHVDDRDSERVARELWRASAAAPGTGA